MMGVFMPPAEAMTRLLRALGLEKGAYTRVVIECTAGRLMKVYTTMIPTADEVLRVVETIDGPEVVADDAVEVVTLTEAKR